MQVIVDASGRLSGKVWDVMESPVASQRCLCINAIAKKVNFKELADMEVERITRELLGMLSRGSLRAVVAAVSCSIQMAQQLKRAFSRRAVRLFLGILAMGYITHESRSEEGMAALLQFSIDLVRSVPSLYLFCIVKAL